MSQYKVAGKVIAKNHDDDKIAFKLTQQMADIYSPYLAYVLDICVYQGEYKIVELNCINDAGFYDADVSKLIQSLEKIK